MKTTRIVQYEHGYVDCPYCDNLILDVEFGTTQIVCDEVTCKKEIKII